MFLYSDSLSLSELFLRLSANWDVWGNGKLVYQRWKKSHWEGKTKTEREKACDKQSCSERVRSCQAGNCPHNVIHLPPQSGCTQELPTTTTPAFSLSHIPTKAGELVLHATAVWNKLSQRQVLLKRKRKEKNRKASSVDSTVAGLTACLPRRHLGSAIVTTMDTADPCGPLKLIQADQQPAPSTLKGTAG